MSSADAPAPGDSVMVDIEDGEEHGGGGGKAAIERVLVGGEGGDFVAQTLSTTDNVADAIKKVQEQGALSTTDAAETEPLLGLLGHLGMTRAEVRRSRAGRVSVVLAVGATLVQYERNEPTNTG